MQKWEKTPKKSWLKALFFVVLIILSNTFFKAYEKKASYKRSPKAQNIISDEELKRLSNSSKKKFSLNYSEQALTGYTTSIKDGLSVYVPTNYAQAQYILRIPNKDYETISLVAPSTHLEYFFVNGYFLDFIPFKVDNVYNAMNFISLRLKYILDEKLFHGSQEVWQTSKEAYKNMRGDCEDHAILLADWLMSLGFDARVAVGTYDKGGHAWVVWFDKGKSYIIEATSKHKRRFYPLASTMPLYEAKYMFNKNSFWLKDKAGFLNDDYMSHWTLVSHFTRTQKER